MPKHDRLSKHKSKKRSLVDEDDTAMPCKKKRRLGHNGDGDENNRKMNRSFRKIKRAPERESLDESEEDSPDQSSIGESTSSESIQSAVCYISYKDEDWHNDDSDEKSEQRVVKDNETDTESDQSTQSVDRHYYESSDNSDDYGAPDEYIGFDERRTDHVNNGKKRWGVWACWEFESYGHCHNPHCKYEHSPVETKKKKSTMTMGFGKHRGKLLHNIPRDYLQWMAKNNVLSNKYPKFVSEMKRLFPDIFKK